MDTPCRLVQDFDENDLTALGESDLQKIKMF